MKSLIITLILSTSVFAADPPKPKPGLSDTQKLRIREVEFRATQLQLNLQRATAPYEMQQTLMEHELNGITQDAIKSFKLDPARWRVNLDTLEFDEIPPPNAGVKEQGKK